MKTGEIDIGDAPSIPGQPTLFDFLVIAALGSGRDPALIALIHALSDRAGRQRAEPGAGEPGHPEPWWTRPAID